jgi:molecular chaperone DnaJ
MPSRDLYQALGVPRDADQAAIRKAFRELAKKYHPDVNKEAGAEARFKEVSAAYEVLGDDQRRALYDEFGEDALRAGFDADRAREARRWGAGPQRRRGSPASEFRGGVDGGPDLDFDEILRGFGMGGGLGGAGARGPGGRARRRGVDLEGHVQVPFMDAIRGGEVTVTVTTPARCDSCKGEGGSGRRDCLACRGTGRRGWSGLGVPCGECGGSGYDYADECSPCGGSGRVRRPRNVKVRIPAGLASGQTLRLRGEGGQGLDGGTPGDLLLQAEVAAHPLLRRSDDDLEMDLPVTLAEAIGGATIEVPTPGGPVRVKVPAGSANGQRLRLSKKGVPGARGPGDLYLVLRPVVPASTAARAVDLARELDALGVPDPRAKLVL